MRSLILKSSRSVIGLAALFAGHSAQAQFLTVPFPDVVIDYFDSGAGGIGMARQRSRLIFVFAQVAEKEGSPLRSGMETVKGRFRPPSSPILVRYHP